MHQPQIELKSFVVERHLCLNTICFWMLAFLSGNTCTKDQKSLQRMLRFTANAKRAGLDASSSSWSFDAWRGGLDGCRCLGGRSGEVLGLFSLTGNFSWEICLIVLFGGQMKYLEYLEFFEEGFDKMMLLWCWLEDGSIECVKLCNRKATYFGS